MALELNGTTGVSLVQDGVVTAADLASGAITSAALPTGSVLQVVSNSTTSQTATTSSTYANLSGLDTSITPTSTSSKILIFLSVPLSGDTDVDGHDVEGQFKLIKTSGGDSDVFESAASMVSRAGQGRFWSWSPNIIDSPATTSAVSYRFFYKRTGGNRSLLINYAQTATMVLMEIAG